VKTYKVTSDLEAIARDAVVLFRQFTSSADAMQRLEDAASVISICYQLSQNGTVYACGNGGSHAQALHLCEELTGRFRRGRRPLGALALGEATHMSCTSNDFGFEDVFKRQVEALGHTNDVLVVLSTSGNSENVCRAANAARMRGMYVVGLLGGDGGRLIELVDLPIVVPSSDSARVQEVHQWVLHALVELVETRVFGIELSLLGSPTTPTKGA
jgi:D-sedoheptulose 7-phosphate isomerase